MRRARHRRAARNHQRMAVIGAALVTVGGEAVTPAAADPADPYIDRYGTEICQAMERNPSHGEVLKAIATVRDYVHLSDEDAEIVVLESMSRICPQYLDLARPTAADQPAASPAG